nr:immunoglobulin heavy chain junction region [Mus musculus]
CARPSMVTRAMDYW